jgi:hypothetical protein
MDREVVNDARERQIPKLKAQIRTVRYVPSLRGMVFICSSGVMILTLAPTVQNSFYSHRHSGIFIGKRNEDVERAWQYGLMD